MNDAELLTSQFPDAPGGVSVFDMKRAFFKQYYGIDIDEHSDDDFTRAFEEAKHRLTQRIIEAGFPTLAATKHFYVPPTWDSQEEEDT